MINRQNLSKSVYKPLDTIIFLILAILIIVFFVVPTAEKTNRFEATINGKKVFEYDFTSGNYSIYDSSKVEVIEEDKFKFISDSGYNILKVDRKKNEATVCETDCGITKECTKMLLSQGSIICVPHNLIIKFSGEIAPPMVG